MTPIPTEASFKYRKKPVEIRAVQYKGMGNFEYPELPDWLWSALEDKTIEPRGDSLLYIKTIEGTMTATVGDYIICGVRGELYSCRAETDRESE
jgi:hypothetical protein